MQARRGWPMEVMGWIGYYGARAVVAVLSKFMWRTEIDGADNIPDEEPYLLCPVHRSNIDGPLSATFTRRRMRYLAKDSMFKFRRIGKLFSAMGAIPVNRGAPDRQSLKTCVELLSSGWPLVLFPEGGRRAGPVVEGVHEGAVYLASRAGVPIVPVGIAGSEEANPKGTMLIKPVKVHVVIGEPMRFDKPEGSDRVPRSVIREGRARLQQRLQELLDESNAKRSS